MFADAVQERQDLRRLLCRQRHRHPPELSLFRRQIRRSVTLDLALNQCRQANGEQPLYYIKDDMAALTAYMAFTSRGKPFDIKIPNDPRALAAYRKGEEYFYTRRGQLNFSCASCHVQSPGDHIRTEVLAPALGILAALPIYRSEWGSMGTISRRFVTCNSQVRGVPLKPAGRALSRRRILSLVHEQRPADLRTGRTPMIVRRAIAYAFCLLIIGVAVASRPRRLAMAASTGRRLQGGATPRRKPPKSKRARSRTNGPRRKQSSRRRKRQPPPAISTRRLSTRQAGRSAGQGIDRPSQGTSKAWKTAVIR